MILGVFWSSWCFWDILVIFMFRGCFRDFSDFRGILVILEVSEDFFFFLILEVLWLF